jgi:hypothetical protein
MTTEMKMLNGSESTNLASGAKRRLKSAGFATGLAFKRRANF